MLGNIIGFFSLFYSRPFLATEARLNPLHLHQETLILRRGAVGVYGSGGEEGREIFSLLASAIAGLRSNPRLESGRATPAEKAPAVPSFRKWHLVSPISYL